MHFRRIPFAIMLGIVFLVILLGSLSTYQVKASTNEVIWYEKNYHYFTVRFTPGVTETVRHGDPITLVFIGNYNAFGEMKLFIDNLDGITATNYFTYAFIPLGPMTRYTVTAQTYYPSINNASFEYEVWLYGRVMDSGFTFWPPQYTSSPVSCTASVDDIYLYTETLTSTHALLLVEKDFNDYMTGTYLDPDYVPYLEVEKVAYSPTQVVWDLSLNSSVRKYVKAGSPHTLTMTAQFGYYWQRCSHDFLIHVGRPHPPIIDEPNYLYLPMVRK